MKTLKSLKVKINTTDLQYQWNKIILKLNQLDRVKIKNESYHEFLNNLL